MTPRLNDYLHRQTLIEITVLNLGSRSLPRESRLLLASDDIGVRLRQIESEFVQQHDVQSVFKYSSINSKFDLKAMAHAIQNHRLCRTVADLIIALNTKDESDLVDERLGELKGLVLGDDLRKHA